MEAWCRYRRMPPIDFAFLMLGYMNEEALNRPVTVVWLFIRVFTTEA